MVPGMWRVPNSVISPCRARSALATARMSSGSWRGARSSSNTMTNKAANNVFFLDFSVRGSSSISSKSAHDSGRAKRTSSSWEENERSRVVAQIASCAADSAGTSLVPPRERAEPHLGQRAFHTRVCSKAASSSVSVRSSRRLQFKHCRVCRHFLSGILDVRFRSRITEATVHFGISMHEFRNSEDQTCGT